MLINSSNYNKTIKEIASIQIESKVTKKITKMFITLKISSLPKNHTNPPILSILCKSN